MIVRQAIGVHFPPGLLTSFAQRREEPGSILVIFEDGLPAIAAVHDVIDRSRTLPLNFLAMRRACSLQSPASILCGSQRQPTQLKSTIIRDPFDVSLISLADIECHWFEADGQTGSPVTEGNKNKKQNARDVRATVAFQHGVLRHR